MGNAHATKLIQHFSLDALIVKEAENFFQYEDTWLGEYYQNAIADLDYCQNQREQ